jgi:hypothetical protein
MNIPVIAIRFTRTFTRIAAFITLTVPVEDGLPDGVYYFFSDCFTSTLGANIECTAVVLKRIGTLSPAKPLTEINMSS